MFFLYRVLTNILYPFFIIFTILRIFKKKEDPVRFKEKIFPSHFNVKKNINSKLLWFHAASVGEFKSIVPLIKSLNKENKNFQFLITTTTISSSNLANTEFISFDNVHHRFFPFDVHFLIKKFIFKWKPEKLFLVDSEIWPNLLLHCKENNIPVAILNARITKKTFQRWMLFPKTSKKIFNLISLFLLSNSQTAEYLSKFHVTENIYNFGNLKLINVLNYKKLKNTNENFLLKNKFWLAASTHKGEENFCIETHIKIKKKYNDIITFIAPRHIHRTNEIKKLCEKANLKCQILNENDLIQEKIEIVIINSYGALNSYFKYCKSVFIGKSLLKNIQSSSGQNPVEAAYLGCKIYHGPYVYNFEEIYKIFEKNKISKEVLTSEFLAKCLLKDLENPKKIEEDYSNNISNFGKKTFTDTMKVINNFIK